MRISSLAEVIKDFPKDVWGRLLWEILIRRAKRSGLTKKWLDEFESAIPCPICREHFIEIRKRYPIHIFSKQVYWVWNAKNVTNTERTNKPFFTFTEFEKKLL